MWGKMRGKQEPSDETNTGHSSTSSQSELLWSIHEDKSCVATGLQLFREQQPPQDNNVKLLQLLMSPVGLNATGATAGHN